jgi:alkylation response protein AidB-like acyl-CoA dehydrogenase
VDFRLDETAATLGELTGEILARELPDQAVAGPEFEAAGYSADAWRAIAAAGVAEAFLPAALGGADADAAVLAAVLRQVALRGGLVPALPVLAYALTTLARYGRAEQHEPMRRVARGEALVTGAVREPWGRRVLDAQTRAEATGDGYRLTGVKNFVPFAREAEVILVPARVADSGGETEVRVFPVPAGTPGLVRTEHKVTDHVPTCRLQLDGVVLPAHAALTGGHLAAVHLEQSALLGLCVTAAGYLERAITLTAEHIKNRRQFGRAIAEFQAVTMQVADAYIAQRTLDNVCLAAAWRLAAGADVRRDLAAASYLVCHDLVPALFTCQHLHGGTGLDLDHPLHRYFTGGLAAGQFLGGTEAVLDAAADRVLAS